jgi:hypothetical protein
MKIICNAILALFFFTANGQTPNSTALADSLLKAGKYKAVTIIYDYPEDVKQIQQKALKNLKSNPEWADKYIVRLVEYGDKDLPYVEGMGLSQQEYNYLRQAFIKDKDIIPVDTFNLIINKVNGVISFKANAKGTAFNDLKINTKTKEITYRNSKVTKEITEYGQNFFAPKLFGYETFSTSPLSSNNKTKLKDFGFCIGVNKGDTKPTLCLMFDHRPIPLPDVLTITIL